jgi:hypothetical protein
MCEVEFWEVFLRKVLDFLSGFLLIPLVDYQLADLERIIGDALNHLASSELLRSCTSSPGYLAIRRQYFPTRTALTSRLMPA